MRVDKFPLGPQVLYADDQGLLSKLDQRCSRWATVIHAMTSGGESAEQRLGLEPVDGEGPGCGETTKEGNLGHITAEGKSLRSSRPVVHTAMSR